VDRIFLFFFCRGRKDFICREFSWREEKRKTAYWRMQEDPETGDPLDRIFLTPVVVMSETFQSLVREDTGKAGAAGRGLTDW
jgi:hypothetical protein